MTITVWTRTDRAILVNALQTIADVEEDWDDVDVWDGLATKSVRSFASKVLELIGKPA